MPADAAAVLSEASGPLHPVAADVPEVEGRAEIEPLALDETRKAGRRRLELRVVDESGARLESPRPEIRMQGPGGRKLATGFSATSRFDGIPVGTWQVSVKAAGFLPVTESIEIVDGITQQLEVRMRAASDLKVRVRARGRPESERVDDSLIALLPLLSVRSEEVGAAAPPAFTKPSVVRESDGCFRVVVALQRSPAAETKVALLLAEREVDAAVAPGPVPEVALELDLELDPAALPSLELTWRPDASGAPVRVLRAHLEALDGRCILRATLREGGSSARIPRCPPGPAKLRAHIEGRGWVDYPVVIPERGEHRIELD
jgi:hypothetical protein